MTQHAQIDWLATRLMQETCFITLDRQDAVNITTDPDEAEEVATLLLDLIAERIRHQGGPVSLPGLGTFHRIHQPGGPTVLFTPDPLLLEDSL